jgi:hypothetical protein
MKVWLRVNKCILEYFTLDIAAYIPRWVKSIATKFLKLIGKDRLSKFLNATNIDTSFSQYVKFSEK